MTSILRFGQIPPAQKRTLPNGQTVGDALAQKTYEPTNPRHRSNVKNQAWSFARLLLEERKLPLTRFALEEEDTPTPVIRLTAPSQQVQEDTQAYLTKLRPADPTHPFEMFPFLRVEILQAPTD